MPTVHIPNNLVETRVTNSVIDGLLWGWHWGATDWGYSFPTSIDEYATFQPSNYNGYLGYGYENVVGMQAFNAQQQSQIVAAVSSFETFLPVTFKANASLGQDAPVVFRFAIADGIDYGYGVPGIGDNGLYTLHGPGGGRSAEAAVPDPLQGNWRAAGDTWYITGAYDTPAPGSFANAAGLLHEFGHAMGLKHGHAQQAVYNQTNRFVDQFGNAFADPFQAGVAPALPTQFDGQEYSVMTYKVYIGDDQTVGNEANDLPSNQVDYPWSYMMLDIAALQYLYGANYGSGSNSGNTTYSFNPGTGQMGTSDTVDGQKVTAASQNAKVFTTIWDGGGIDTYDFSNHASNQTIDLQPGFWSTFSDSQVARLGVNINARGNIANALLYNNDTSSLIENAVGGSGNDTITGNVLNNILNGNGGMDTAVFATTRSSSTVTANADGSFTVNVSGGGLGIDTVQNMERLHFNDGVLAIDLDGTAGQTYRLYKAAFDRNPDQTGLSHNVNLMDQGLSIFDMANAFIDSQEFQNTYGSNVNNTSFVTLLYQNVLNRAPDQPGLDGWLSQLNGGTERKSVLFGFSESTENKAAVAPLIDDGIWLA